MKLKSHYREASTGVSNLLEAVKRASDNYGLVPDVTPDNNIKTFIDNYTKISKKENWNQMNMSTAQGGAALDSAFWGCSFDGRYIYYVPYYKIGRAHV